MNIRVEFYGIPRQRAGVAETIFEAPGEGSRLGDILEQVAGRFPTLTIDCIQQGQLCTGCSASINGERFVSSPTETLPPGSSLLIMSADAGG